MTATQPSELLPCRKCGALDYKMWDGRGTQADLYCNSCGQEEGIQVVDSFDSHERPDFNNETLRYPDAAVERVKEQLIVEWNTRAVAPAPRAPGDEEVRQFIATLRGKADDWMHVYAPDMCDADQVNIASKRIGEHGTLYYIAIVQQQNRQALASEGNAGKKSPLPARCKVRKVWKTPDFTCDGWNWICDTCSGERSHEITSCLSTPEPIKVIEAVLEPGIIGETPGGACFVAADIVEHLEREGYVIVRKAGAPTQRSVMTSAAPSERERQLSARDRLRKLADELVADAFISDMHDDPDKGVREIERLTGDFIAKLNLFACDEIGRDRDARAALATHSDGADGWRDISTAPKDGTTILIAAWESISLASWNCRGAWNLQADPETLAYDLRGEILTLEGEMVKQWQPLPLPPSSGEG